MLPGLGDEFLRGIDVAEGFLAERGEDVHIAVFRLLQRLSFEQGRGHGKLARQLVVVVDAVDDGGIAVPTVERMGQDIVLDLSRALVPSPPLSDGLSSPSRSRNGFARAGADGSLGLKSGLGMFG